MKSKIFYTFLICIQTIVLISCNQDSTINNNEKSEVITLPLKIDTENVSIIEEPFQGILQTMTFMSSKLHIIQQEVILYHHMLMEFSTT